jgi:SAM-dependent methyltransferase
VATYAFDQEWAEERKRLAGIEVLWDEGTHAVMERIGVGSGWRCLEVGAGGGSMVEWVSDRVGPEGHVLAVDISTRFLEAIERPNVEVRQLDVLSDELPQGEFDLVYSRLVAEHLGPVVLEKMHGALRPGGVLLAEDYDWGGATAYPLDPLVEEATDKLLGFMESLGFQRNFGQQLPTLLRGLGLEGVQAEGRARLLRGGTPEMDFYRLTALRMRDTLIEQGIFDERHAEALAAQVEDPDATFITPLVVSAWGRVPE